MPTSRARAALVAVVAVAVGVLPLVWLQGCTSTGDEPAGAGVPTPTLSGQLTRYRSDEALRRVQVKLGQTAGEPAAEVTSLQLSLPGYEVGPVTARDVTSLPGSVVDLPVDLGEPVCPRAGQPTTEDAVPAGTAVAVATVRGPDGPVEVEVALSDPDGVGPQTWSRECSSLAALAAAPLELGGTWTRGSAGATLTASGELVVGPVTDGRRVEVVEVVGTTLFSALAQLPVDLAAGQALSVPLVVAPARCDPHAVGESKRGYAFGVRVVVDGGDPVLVTVEPTEAARVQMEDVLLEQCGLD